MGRSKLYLSLALHAKDWRFREEAEKHAIEAQNLSDELGLMEFVIQALIARAGVFRMRKQVEEAETLIRSAILLAARCNMRHVGIDALIEQGKLQLLRGNMKAAIETGELSRQLAQETLYGRCARDLKPLIPVPNPAPANAAQLS